MKYKLVRKNCLKNKIFLNVYKKKDNKFGKINL